MPERPLLLFPAPERASRSALSGGGGRFHRPTPQQQWERLSPIFNQLRIQQNTSGIDPEQVLVIETIGSVDNFTNAVKRIEGLEWMGELEIDEIPPDKDFHDENKPEKELSGRLYLVMTNQQAQDRVLSLWRQYKDNTKIKFDRGLTKFRDVFLSLKDIRRWGVQDRLSETGVIDAWREDLEHDGNKLIRFETELWFRSSIEKRQDSANMISNLIEQCGGRIISQTIHEGIAYHGLLAELPASEIQSVVNNPNTELVKCDKIMFFRPVGQMVTEGSLVDTDIEFENSENNTFPSGDPIVAILDGFPLGNHRLLNGRLIIDDPDNWEAAYSTSERVHGTSMASLVVRGDLNDHVLPLGRPVYVRPIMKPNANDFQTPRREFVPDDVLFVDLIHLAVKRIFDGDGQEDPVAPSVKVINLSIGDPNRQFLQSMSPVARLLDWLSTKYGVLFVVSAGNHKKSIPLGISQNEVDALRPSELEAETIRAIYRDVRHRKLLSPGESINALTIGAVHYDASQFTRPGDINPFNQVLPSPVSAFGSGYRRAIKPDLVFYGGRQLYRHSLREPGTIDPAIFRAAPGNKIASPSSLSGELTATAYSCGTSNATALISRAAGICYDSLQQIFNEQLTEIVPRTYEVPLLKAILVHGCSWGDIGARISDVLSTPQNVHHLRGLKSQWMGYGMPQIDRVLDCTNQRATLLGFGQLLDGEAHVFRLPLPPSLGARSEWRRLTVTLAWLSPISASTQKYRTASLWFEITNNELTPTRSDADGRAVRRGTVQHEVFEGQRAEPFIDGDVIEIKVNCREDAGKILTPVAYGLAVSLEVKEDVDIAVYDEIRTRIAPAVQIQQASDRGRQ
jgi:hypothetical protein